MKDQQNNPKALEHPTDWNEAYSAADRVNTLAVIDWLNAHQKRQSWLKRLANLNEGTLNVVLKGGYSSSPTKFLAKALEALKRFEDREKISAVPFVETSVYRMIHAVCHRAHTYRNFGVIAGAVGTGKTFGLKEYARRNPSVILIEADPDMTPVTLLEDLMEATGAVASDGTRRQRGTKNKMFRAVLSALQGSSRLIVMDEAETITDSALEYLRRIRDKAEIGVVLAGTEFLHSKIKPERGQFDQIRSRVGFWPKPIRGITREDCDSIVQISFEDQGEIEPAVLDAIWAYTQGSIRTLVEDMVPALRDFGLRRGHGMTPDLVQKIAREILTLTAMKEVA